MMKPLLLLMLIPALAAAAAPSTGEVSLPQVSGAAVVRDGRLLLVGEGTNGLYLLEGGAERLQAPRLEPKPSESLSPQLQGKVELEDLEDAAWDGARDLFLTGSHARTPQGDSPEARYRLARLTFDATGRLLEARQSDALLQAIQTDVPFLADSIRRTPARTGLNVEGLAITPEGHLLLGLRAPTITESAPRPHGGQEDAVILRLKNPDAVFENPPLPASLGDTVKLDLRGHGIRGMTYDRTRKGVWILSGLSAEPTHPVTSPWGLWFWDEKGAPKPVTLPNAPALKSPEAICVMEKEGAPYLLLFDPDQPTGRFAVVPMPVVP